MPKRVRRQHAPGFGLSSGSEDHRAHPLLSKVGSSPTRLAMMRKGGSTSCQSDTDAWWERREGLCVDQLGPGRALGQLWRATICIGDRTILWSSKGVLVLRTLAHL